MIRSLKTNTAPLLLLTLLTALLLTISCTAETATVNAPTPTQTETSEPQEADPVTEAGSDPLIYNGQGHGDYPMDDAHQADIAAALAEMAQEFAHLIGNEFPEAGAVYHDHLPQEMLNLSAANGAFAFHAGSVTVAGYGTAVMPPDQMTAQLTLTANGTNPSEAVGRLQETAAKIADAIPTPNTPLNFSQLSVAPAKSGQGYTAIRQALINATLNGNGNAEAITTASRSVDQILAAGGENLKVNAITLTRSPERMLAMRREAQVNALNDAREQMKLIVNTYQAELGPPIQVDFTGSPAPDQSDADLAQAIVTVTFPIVGEGVAEASDPGMMPMPSPKETQEGNITP